MIGELGELFDWVRAAFGGGGICSPLSIAELRTMIGRMKRRLTLFGMFVVA